MPTLRTYAPDMPGAIVELNKQLFAIRRGHARDGRHPRSGYRS